MTMFNIAIVLYNNDPFLDHFNTKKRRAAKPSKSEYIERTNLREFKAEEELQRKLSSECANFKSVCWQEALIL